MEAYMGTICAFGFNFAPYGWAQCNGQILPISSNAALFSLLGTYYGGNGTSTFGLPNLQGRTAICQGQLQGGSIYVIGETGGVDTVSILLSNMPAHSHTVTAQMNAYTGSRPAADSSDPTNTFPAIPSNSVSIYNVGASTGSFLKSAPTVTLGTAGGSIPISISDPTLVMNYSIALQGIFPTRN